MLTLVTVIYGDKHCYRVELFGSVLSALALTRETDLRIVVYTDRPLDNFPLPVTEKIISAADWDNWTNSSSVTHLVKLHLVSQTLKAGDGPVIYFDTDTLFQAPPEALAARLEPGRALMHANEGPIANHDVWKKICLWLGNGRKVGGTAISPATEMFNSGVVGIVPEHGPALLRAIDIAATLYDVDPIFSLDQFSTGAALGGQGAVDTCEDEVFHYWGWNRLFVRDAIDAFWQQHAGRSVDELRAAFNPHDYTQLPLIHWSDKLHARIQEFRWRLNQDGRLACLALRSALRSGSADGENANRWFSVHMKQLATLQDSDRNNARRLARAFADDYALCQAWLNTGNKTALEQLVTDTSG